MMLDDRHGSLFDAPVRALVNPVNCDGVMGAGLALEFKQRFPEAFEDYRRACQRGELKPGAIHTYQLSDGRWIVNFPTKTRWKTKSKMEYIEAGLPVLVDWIRMNAVASIGIPALGCGLGKLSWNTGVKPRIERAFDEITGGMVDVWLFGPEKK